MSFIEREMKVVQVLFDRAVAPYLQDRRERLQFIDPWNGSPRWIRERDALNQLWSEQTAPARKLLAITEREILEFGEMTEATALAWEALMPMSKEVEDTLLMLVDVVDWESKASPQSGPRTSHPIYELS